MSKSLRDEIRTILAVGIAAVVMSPAALAQEQQKPEEQKEEKAASETEFQEVVVTGSRIRRTEFDSPAPVSVITSERSQLAGLLSTEQILRENTAAAQGQQINDSFAGFVTDGGAGANTISLRGLGAQRTLVLVNGKRWTPSGVQGRTNSVDLTAIPSSIISRIEILKDGASSVYGADAVAGVINVITKESLDGLQLNAQGQATHDGGAERYVIDGSFGKVGDRGSFSISAQYQEQKELNAADRDWSACPVLKRWTDQDGNGVIDNADPFTGEPLCFGFQRFNNSALGAFRFEPSLSDPFDTTNPNYDPRAAAYGIPFMTRVPPSGFAPGSPPLTGGTARPPSLYDNEGRWYRDELSPSISNIVTPTELISATSFGQLDFDIGAGTSTVYYEAFYNQRKTKSSFGHRQFAPFVNGTTYDGANLHPYNVFSSLELLGAGLGGALAVVPSYEFQNPYTTVDIERYNVFAGIRGDLAGDWDYDVVVGYGYSQGTYKREQWLADRVEAAVNGIIVQADGSVVCAPDVAADFPGCVPLNAFSEDLQMRGVMPADARDFITKMTKGETTYDGYSASGYATGPLFSLPAGSVKAVLGVEYRSESIDDIPDPDFIAGNILNFASSVRTKGTDKVKEVFGEIEIPLLRDRAFAENMFLSGSARWTDYDSYGSDTTYRAAFNYQITPQFLVRSTYGTSFRAPDLYEQFLGDSEGFLNPGSLFDPCTQYGDTFQPGDAIYDNCQSQGLPPDFFPTSGIKSITGGADDLEAETSDSLTIGLVFTPEAGNVSFAIDYFDIEIEDTVESPSGGFLLNQCYRSNNFSSPFCSRIGPRNTYIPGTGGTPGQGGGLQFVDTSFVNIGKQQSRGFDFNFLFEHQFEVGALTIDGIVTYLDKQNYELFGEFTRLEGRWGYPRLSANAQIRYDWRDWRFGWFMNFIGESQEACEADDPVTSSRCFDPGTANQDRSNRLPNTLYHTLSLRYQQANWEAIASVRNVFDKDPPYAADISGIEVNRFYNTLPGVGYDLLGRAYVLQLSYQF